MYGADPIILFPQPLHTRFIPVYTGVECVNTYYKTIREWLIPVYTGQMPLICRSRTSRKVHPRVYGADSLNSSIFLFAAGSSLCVRGRYQDRPEEILLHGLIPVCTGADFASPLRVPLMLRFIPVRTGQIDATLKFRIPYTVHPRAYGADTKFLKQIPVVSKPFFVLDFCNKTSMYHFRLSYFCG